MGRGWKRARKLSAAPVPYPTTVLQGVEAESQGQEFRRDYRKRLAHPDLDSPDRHPATEMAAPSVESQMVAVQSGLDVAAEPVYLSRFDRLAR